MANEILDQVKDLNNTADTTSQYDANDIANNKVMAILAYIWILFLIPMFAAKDSKFARYHANQGLVLFLANIVVSIVSAVIGLIPVVGAIIGWVLSIILLVLMVLGIVNAATGKAKALPVIGGITILK